MANYKTGIMITGDASGAIKQMKLAADQLEALNKSQKKTSNDWGKLAKQAAVVGAAAAAAAAAGLAAMVKSSVNAADAARKAAQGAGVTTEAFTGLQHAAELSGVSSDKLSSSLGRFNKTISEAAKGSKSQAQVFADMGLSVTDAEGRLKSADKMLLEVAGKFAGYEDGASKAALAQELFGKGGAAMIPLLNQGADGIASMTQQAERLGLVISDETAAAAEQFNDSLTVLGAVGRGVSNTMMKDMLPAMNSVTGLMLDYAENSDIAATASAALGAVLKALISVGVTIGAVFEAVGKRIGAVAAAFMAAVKGDFNGAWAIMQESNQDTVAIAEKAVERIGKLWSGDYAKAGADAAATSKAIKEQFTATGKSVEDSLKAQESAMMSAEKAVERYLEQEARLAAQRAKTVETLEYQVSALERELIAVNAGEAAQAALNRELFIESAIRSEIANKDIPGHMARIEELAAKQYDLKTAIEAARESQTASAQAAKQAADDSAAAWVEATKRIDGAFADMWKGAFKSWKDFRDRLKDAFIQFLAELAHRATTQKILITMGLGTSGSAFAGGGGGGGGLSSLLSLGSLASTGKTLWSGISGLASGQGLSGFAGLFGGGATAGLEVPAHMMTRAAAQQAASLSNFANTMGPILGGLAGAIQGWQYAGAKGAVGGAAGGYLGAKGGAALGTAILPGIGTAIGAALGAMLGSSLGSKIFGGQWETKDTGISLGFGSDGFDPQQFAYQKKKGGLFGSDKKRTRFSELDAARAEMLGSTYDATVSGVKALYEQIGIAVDQSALEAVQTGAMQISGKLSAEEMEAKVAEWFGQLSDALTRSVDSSLDAASLQRLALSLGAVNAVLKTLGHGLYDTSKAGAEMAANLLDIAGGLEAFAAAADFYYQNFYSEAERLEAATAQVSGAMASLGLAMPESHAGFRQLVESMDRTTEAGRSTYVALLQLSPAFDQVTKAAEQARQQLIQELWSVVDQAFAALEKSVEAEKAAISEVHAARLSALESEKAALFARVETARGAIDYAMAGLENAVSQQVAALNEAHSARLSALQAERQALVEQYASAGQAVADTLTPVKDRLKELETVASSLRGALKAMRLESQAYDLAARRRAQATISGALGGNLPGAEIIAGAVEELARPSAQLFGSFAEYAFDQAVTRAALGSLLEEVEAQIPIEQRTLEELERQREEAASQHQQALARIDERTRQAQEQHQQSVVGVQAQLDIARNQIAAIGGVGNNVATLSDVTRAIATYQQTAAMAASQVTKIDQQIAAEKANHDSEIARLNGILAAESEQINQLKGINGGVLTVAQAIERLRAAMTAVSAVDPNAAVVTAFQAILGRNPQQAGLEYWTGQLSSGAVTMETLYRTIATAALQHEQDKAAASKYLGLPGFADGGSHKGGLRIVGERGPEIELTGPSRILSNRDSRKLLDNSRLEKLVETLTAEVVQLRAENRAGHVATATNTRDVAKKLNKWDKDGQPAERTA